MPEYALTPYRPALSDGLAGLWETVFGDPAPLVRQFLDLWPGSDFCLTALQNGIVSAAAYALPGLTILRPGQPDLPARYLYAVATHPDHRDRGLAAMLCRRLRDDCFARGELLLTKPAEPSLYAWYAEKIGAVPTLPCHTLTVTEPAAGTVTRLSPEEYAARREALLANAPHTRLPDTLFQWEHLLHTHYGGGFFATDRAIADAFFDEQRAEIAELLSPAPEQDAGILLSHFRTPSVSVTCPGGTETYVSCAAPDILPDALCSVWFGPVFG